MAPWALQPLRGPPSDSHRWAHSLTLAGTAGLRKAGPCSSGTCPSGLGGVTSATPARCLVQFDICWCTKIRAIFPTKGFDESLIKWFQRFHSKLRVSIKKEPTGNMNYYSVVTFCNLYSGYFCSAALRKQLCCSGVIPPLSTSPQGWRVLDTTWKTD